MRGYEYTFARVHVQHTPRGVRSGERSLSVRLELLDDERPLNEARIESVVADVLAALIARLGVRLRA